MFKFADLQKEICLTCQYYNIPRRIEVIGSKMFIDYDSSTGGCKLCNNFPKPCTSKPFSGHWCHYKRWVELP
jgi:hypothetical protein